MRGPLQANLHHNFEGTFSSHSWQTFIEGPKSLLPEVYSLFSDEVQCGGPGRCDCAPRLLGLNTFKSQPWNEPAAVGTLCESKYSTSSTLHTLLCARSPITCGLLYFSVKDTLSALKVTR